MDKTSKKVRANEQIRVPEIRLIGADGSQLGIVQTRDGLKMAQDQGLDLVEVAATVRPPVCRLMDLGKYIYSLSKKEKEARKKQKVISVKEVKMTPKIEDHDFQTKVRNARKFLERGDKVKLTVFFRGREITHKEIGERLIKRFIEETSDIGEVERNDGLEGNAIHMYFTAKPLVKKPVSTNPSEKGSDDAKTED